MDTSAFGGGIRSYSQFVELKESLLHKTDYSTTDIEALQDLTNQIYFVCRFTDNTYQKVKSSGITELSGLKNISDKISIYYNKIQNFHNVLMDWEVLGVNKNSDYWELGQNFYEISYSGLPIIQYEKENRLNLIGLIESPQGRNQLKDDLYRKKRMLDHYNLVHDLASELIILIQKELNLVNEL